MRSPLPKALTSTGISKPCTRSKRRATLASPRALETRSTISVISRSRETGAVSDDGEGEARDHAHPHELPPHERRLPRDDALQPEERPRGHVGDQRGQRRAGVRQGHEKRHAHHRPAGRDDAGHHGHHETLHARLAAEVARDDFLRDDDLEEAGQQQRRDQSRQHEAEHRETVARADQRERRVLEVRDHREHEGKSCQDQRGGIEAHRPGLWHIVSRRFARAPRRLCGCREVRVLEILQDARPLDGLCKNDVGPRLARPRQERLTVAGHDHDARRAGRPGPKLANQHVGRLRSRGCEHP